MDNGDLINLKKKIIKFTFFSGVGLIIDLLIFYLLTELSFYIFWSNIISGFSAIFFVYLTLTKYVHYQKQYDIKNFLIFICYYILSICFFSFIILFISINLETSSLISKLIVVPLSLIINYFFTSKIMVK